MDFLERFFSFCVLLFTVTLIFFSSVLKFLFNSKNLIISLVRLELVGLSIFIFMLRMERFLHFEFFFIFYICFIVRGRCLGLILLIILGLRSKKELENSIKNILC